MYIIQNRLNHSSGKSEELFFKEITSENAVRYCVDIRLAKRFDTFELAKQELYKILAMYSKSEKSNYEHIFAIYHI